MSYLLPVPDHLSFSQVSKLVPEFEYACAASWAFERRAGIPFIASRAMQVGTAFDMAVTELFGPRARAGGDLSVPLDLPNALERLTFEIDMLMEEADEEGRAEIAPVLTVLPPTLEAYSRLHEQTPVAAVQRSADWEWDGIVVTGFIDRVDVGRKITDLKVSGAAAQNADGSWDQGRLASWRAQLAFYAAALEASALDAGLTFDWPVPVGIDLVVVRARQVAPKIQQWSGEVTEADRDAVRRWIARAWSIATSGRYPARPGPNCARCAYIEPCREVQLLSAGDFDAAWSGVK